MQGANPCLCTILITIFIKVGNIFFLPNFSILRPKINFQTIYLYNIGREKVMKTILKINLILFLTLITFYVIGKIRSYKKFV